MNRQSTEHSNLLSMHTTDQMQQTTTIRSECKVCGASARYSYYGAIVCQSCKVFFRRNAQSRQVSTASYMNEHVY